MARKYLVYSKLNGTGKFIDDRDDDQWDEDYMKFRAGHCGGDLPKVVCLDDCEKEGQIRYEESYSRDGVYFTLWQMPENTAESVWEAIAKLRRERDMTGYQVLRVTKLLDSDAVPA